VAGLFLKPMMDVSLISRPLRYQYLKGLEIKEMLPHHTIAPRLDIFPQTIIHLGYVSIYERRYVPNNNRG
jgi:hypothetical protein